MADGDLDDLYGDLVPAAPSKASSATASPPAMSLPASPAPEPAVSTPVVEDHRALATRLREASTKKRAPEPVAAKTTANAAPKTAGSAGFFGNKVWVPPGATPPPSPKSDPSCPTMQAMADPYGYEDGLVVDAGKVVALSSSIDAAGVQAIEADRPEDFEALQRELMADERQAPPPVSPGVKSISSVEDAGEESEGSDCEVINLGEVKASQTGAAPRPAFGTPRRWAGQRPGNVGSVVSAPSRENEASNEKRKEVSLYIGAPPLVPQSTGMAECLLLVGGLPWWLTDAELRRLAEQFGQIRCIRILDYVRSGKSAGIALLEFVAPDSAQRASLPREGLCSLAAWGLMEVAPPRLVQVSREFFQMLRAGFLPWPDGGPCPEDLRSTLMRQFGLSHKTGAGQAQPLERERSRGRHRDSHREGHRDSHRGGSPGRAQRQQLDGDPRLERPASTLAASPEPEKPRREEASGAGWADKLKRLSGNVNKRQEVDMEAARRKVNRRL